MIVPKLEEMQKESDAGRAKINKYTRIATIPLAILQGYGFITLFQRQGSQAGVQLIGDIGPWQMVTALVAVTAGTIFLMWLGELISEKNVGNGISLLIFAGMNKLATDARIDNCMCSSTSKALPLRCCFICLFSSR